MARVFIGVGSNLGDRGKNLYKAQFLLERAEAVTFLRSSRVYETEPVGGPPQGKYLNTVWEIETTQSAQELLKTLLSIETALGRKRSGRNFPRAIDLDILFYDRMLIDEKGLTIPHPRLHERSFVLKPLAELIPQWVHPQLNQTIRNLLEDLLERNSKI